jgi:ribosome-associated protein
MKRTIEINTPWIKLDSLLKLADVAESGGTAKMIIRDGAVKVNDSTVTQRGRKIVPGDTVEIDAEPGIILEIKAKREL